MKTTIYLTGGLGKVITAIPACEKFVKKNPNTTIVLSWHTPVLFGNPILTDKVFDFSTKGLHEKIKDTKILAPEPYFNNDYLNGKINLADAWNQEINGDKESMPVPKLYISKYEYNISKAVKPNSNPTIAFQPFGNSAIIENNDITDNSYRSLPKHLTIELVKLFKRLGANIFLVTNQQITFLNAVDFVNYYPPDVRHYMAAINHCDYFVGVDSSGQHIARSYDIPGTIIMGASNTVNTTYPDFFNVINDNPEKPYQFFGPLNDIFDNYLNNVRNSFVMDFTEKDIKDICNKIQKHFKTHIKKK